ncbi:WD40 domain-containing protein [Streptomyces coelicoflavus]|uniref:WD40 repeat domain-containing protein n=1 Tax=Streptomyces coelicoflavus TaxID=285562 RepID=UPI00210E419E|nr:WD40 repeat domain-containing protein [Streptomyces coelicoflavus]MCQ4200345.1 WD40 domain-containing protein [Streptomyces coelicoflavus]
MTAGAWARPAAGREPAGAALLGWLADPTAPRLCLVTGSENSGKSQLLAWLVTHSTRPGTAPERRVHGFVPLAGQGVRTALWTLADQLGVAARAPGELLAELSADPRRTVLVLPDLHTATEPGALADIVGALADLEHVRILVEARTGHEVIAALRALSPAEMDLDASQWTDPARAEAWQAAHPTRHESTTPGTEGTTAPVDLDDPVEVCAADPGQVTTAYEADTESRDGLRRAWLRAGQSLMRDQEPADRALVLLAALGDGADPRLSPPLERLAAGAPWRLVWSRVRGDVTPPWSGPVMALTVTSGSLPEQLLVADHQGTLRSLSYSDATPVGRLPGLAPDALGLVCLPDATVVVLDGDGRLHIHRAPTAPGPSGLAALLDDGPGAGEQAIETLSTAVTHTRITALGASEHAVAVADHTGRVYGVFLSDPGRLVAAEHLHEGPVTALAVADVPVAASEPDVSLVYSGGADGRVRVWGPGKKPMDVPVAERATPVRALAARMTASGLTLSIAWSDGLVEHRRLDAAERRTFHPGHPVNVLALTRTEELLIGTDELLTCLRPA